MEIFVFLWQQYLFIPLFNALIWLYVGIADFHLGIAIILLTIAIRILLLPFTILNEKGKVISQRLRRELAEVKKDYASDPVLQKEKMREVLRRRKIRPWAKAVVLGLQGVAILVLYQVFVGGINSRENIQVLYPGIPRPDFINTQFLWFDVGQKDILLAALVAGVLFAEILIGQWGRRKLMRQGEFIFMVLFPASVFLVLALIPSAKALFVLTSLLFSAIVTAITAMIKVARKKNQPGQQPQ